MIVLVIVAFLLSCFALYLNYRLWEKIRRLERELRRSRGLGE